MSQSFTQCNMVATPIKDLPKDKNRRYLALIATADCVVVLSGGEPFTVIAGSVWSPIPAPINDMAITGTGTLILG